MIQCIKLIDIINLIVTPIVNCKEIKMKNEDTRIIFNERIHNWPIFYQLNSWCPCQLLLVFEFLA